jgi:hypothetical protein
MYNLSVIDLLWPKDLSGFKNLTGMIVVILEFKALALGEVILDSKRSSGTLKL